VDQSAVGRLLKTEMLLSTRQVGLEAVKVMLIVETLVRKTSHGPTMEPAHWQQNSPERATGLETAQSG